MSSLPYCAPPPSPWELSRLVMGRSCVLRREGRESTSENDGGWTRSDLIRWQISGQDGGSIRINLKMKKEAKPASTSRLGSKRPSQIKGSKREIIQPREAKDDILSAKEQFHHKLSTRDRFLILSSDEAQRTGKQSRRGEKILVIHWRRRWWWRRMAASTSGDGMEGAAELDPYTSCDDELGEVLVLDEASDEELAEALQLSLSAGRGAPRATGGGRGFWCGDVAVAEDGDGPTARGLGQELRPAAAEGLEQELRRPVLDQRMEAGRRRGAWGSSFGRRRWRAWSRSSCGRRRKGWSSSSGGQQWMAWSNSSRGN